MKLALTGFIKYVLTFLVIFVLSITKLKLLAASSSTFWFKMFQFLNQNMCQVFIERNYFSNCSLVGRITFISDIFLPPTSKPAKIFNQIYSLIRILFKSLMPIFIIFQFVNHINLKIYEIHDSQKYRNLVKQWT